MEHIFGGDRSAAKSQVIKHLIEPIKPRKIIHMYMEGYPGSSILPSRIWESRIKEILETPPYLSFWRKLLREGRERAVLSIILTDPTILLTPVIPLPEKKKKVW